MDMKEKQNTATFLNDNIMSIREVRGNNFINNQESTKQVLETKKNK